MQVVPLRRLLRKSTVLVDLRDSQESELSILKAVKRKGTDVFEARIILSSPGEAPGRPRDIPNMGGYQVRGKNWRIWSEDQPETYSKEYWDDRTAYVVLMLIPTSEPKHADPFPLIGKYPAYISYLCRGRSFVELFFIARFSPATANPKHSVPSTSSGQTR